MERTKSKPSYYKSDSGKKIYFKSYLEMKWAYFFDMLGLQWEYEPNLSEYGIKYTPDFSIKDLGIIEIKPTFEHLKNEGFKKLSYTSKVLSKYNIRIYSIFGEFPFIGRNFFKWDLDGVIILDYIEVLNIIKLISPVLKYYETADDINKVIEIILRTSNSPVKNPIPLSEIIPNLLKEIEYRGNLL